MPVTTVPCPICHKKVIWSTENAFRPFCSQRCKQIDLGAWASGSYAITPSSPEEASEHIATDPT